jgi:hypothetical protein
MGKYFFNPGPGEHWISVRLLLIGIKESRRNQGGIKEA